MRRHSGGEDVTSALCCIARARPFAFLFMFLIPPPTRRRIVSSLHLLCTLSFFRPNLVYMVNRVVGGLRAFPRNSSIPSYRAGKITGSNCKKTHEWGRKGSWLRYLLTKLLL
jgi:hypothetical protein